MKRIDILTLFPEMCGAAFNESIVARAVRAGLIEIECHQIRDYTDNRQGKVDDYPYGGGPGLIMSYQPIKACYDAVNAQVDGGRTRPYTVYMSPQGTPFTQKVARRLAEHDRLTVICGHYEGVDERVIEELVDEEISMGDFVLTGGEIPAMALVDCVARLVPGVLACEEAYENESHSDLLLEYAQYTRPEEIGGRRVPEVLLGGNHADIENWRLEDAKARTQRKRPDLYAAYAQRERDRNTYYFDNSATTKPSETSLKVYAEVAANTFGNPSSLHGLGLSAEKLLAGARGTISDIIGGKAGHIYFTSGATESNNWVFRGILPANPRLGRHVLISAVEHPSVTESALALTELGYEVETVPVGADGRVDPDVLASMIRPDDTALVSVMHVNSETGAVQPVEELARRAKEIRPSLLFHSDCVQSFGKLPLDLSRSAVDMISASSHKIHGPRGTGFLYVRDKIKVRPLMYGGGQENGMRSGTENLPGICAFAAAAKEISENMAEKLEKAAKMREILLNALGAIRACKVAEAAEQSPYIINAAFPGLRAEVILHTLETYGIYVSVGSACSSHKKGRSQVLTAMGYDTKTIDGAIRISLSPQNTEAQCEYAGGVIVREIKKLYVLHTVRKGRH